MTARATTAAITIPAIAPAERSSSSGLGAGGFCVVTVGLVVVDGVIITKLDAVTVIFRPSQTVITNAPVSTKV